MADPDTLASAPEVRRLAGLDERPDIDGDIRDIVSDERNVRLGTTRTPTTATCTLRPGEERRHRRDLRTHLRGRGVTIDEAEYWGRLEYRICAEFSGFADEPLRRFWCDGLVPAEYDLQGSEPSIRGQAWCGLDGQDHWGFTLLVGPDMRSRADLDWAALLPDERLTGWLSPHPDEKRMTIDPLGGYPD